MPQNEKYILSLSKFGLQLSGVFQILDVVAECLKSPTTCHIAQIVQLHNAYANLQYFARYQIVDIVADGEIWWAYFSAIFKGVLIKKMNKKIDITNFESTPKCKIHSSNCRFWPQPSDHKILRCRWCFFLVWLSNQSSSLASKTIRTLEKFFRPSIFILISSVANSHDTLSCFTQHSSIPSFHHSSCEWSELSSSLCHPYKTLNDI